MLKRFVVGLAVLVLLQPPSGGCVLKQSYRQVSLYQTDQPPSGGCVLKLVKLFLHFAVFFYPAAFRRLCVETGRPPPDLCLGEPAAFRRLCVETTMLSRRQQERAPAAFRRLCVETAKHF